MQPTSDERSLGLLAAVCRLQVERFQVAEPKETEELAIPEGKGAKLRDIPNVAHKMGKLTGVLPAAHSWVHALWWRVAYLFRLGPLLHTASFADGAPPALLTSLAHVLPLQPCLAGKDELMEGLHNVLYRRKGAVGGSVVVQRDAAALQRAALQQLCQVLWLRVFCLCH